MSLKASNCSQIRSKYTIELQSGTRTFSKSEAERLISSCDPQPDSFVSYQTGTVAARLVFGEWARALQAVVFLWRRRLSGHHLFTPEVKFGYVTRSENPEISDRLANLFKSRVRYLLKADIVSVCQSKIDDLNDEIAHVTQLLGGRNSLLNSHQYLARREELYEQKEQIVRRLDEYKAAMLCILSHLDGPQWESSAQDVEVFEFKGGTKWDRLHRLLARERNRVVEALPIYGHRREILKRFQTEQAMILIGETGSGKSTQLVQFLVDSGLGGDGLILCTQPRKIAAMSLAQRVRDESNGCYSDNSITYHSTYFSSQKLNGKVVFITDHCLLQLYMQDTKLRGITCIIIDEAHERTLNTDLLLSLIKKLMLERRNLKVLAMSATADATKLSDYFGCGVFHVKGRNFPVEIEYVPDESTESSFTRSCERNRKYFGSYVSNAVKMVTEIHKNEEDGAVLVFLTSQMEVEWACDNVQSPTAVTLPLHGKLSSEEQNKVFQNYPGKRKILFSTNLAETSLTIPEVKYVVDSGMVKESRFEPGSGMNLLRVCRISQSSANQRAGRAGRTAPGKCFRLYSELDFQSFSLHQEPEIHRVHLGVAILRIIAIGINTVQDFDFVDAPSQKSVELAIKNLILLGAIRLENNILELTFVGWKLVKMGINPQLGKLILNSFDHGLGREGIVLASVMANASGIFCRVGDDEEKLKADCLKVQFCHEDGDLFTLLSVYKKWEEENHLSRNAWCWKNSVNAKAIRRCRETVLELENCLQQELHIIIPTYWKWNPHGPTEYTKVLKNVILSSLSENIAIYSGSNQLGYEVASTGQHAQLHPSCSLRIYGQNPTWVVFGEILSTSNQYLLCVTSVERDSLLSIWPSLPLDILFLESQKLQKHVINDVGNNLLRRFCGKSNSKLQNIISYIQRDCRDDRIHIDVDFDRREIHLFNSLTSAKRASTFLNWIVENEKTLLRNECNEKCLFSVGPGFYPSVALFGSGATIKHLEVEGRYFSVEVFHPNAHSLDDRELLSVFNKVATGIASFHRQRSWGKEGENLEKWGKVTFLNPQGAENAVEELNGVEIIGSPLKVVPLPVASSEHRTFPFPALTAKLTWPRRNLKGVAVVRCASEDVPFIAQVCESMVIKGRFVRCEISNKYTNSVIVTGLRKDITEQEIFEAFLTETNRTILDVFLPRSQPVCKPSSDSCADVLRREIAHFMPEKSCPTKNFWVKVFPPEPKDYLMKAVVTFDGGLHLEAAKALHHLHGKVLDGCLSWQNLECHQMFQSSVSCPAEVYPIIKQELTHLFENFKHLKGVTYNMEQNGNGPYRVKICANATRTVAKLRKPLEQLMKGKTISHADLTPGVLQLLFNKKGIEMMKAVQKETRTYILHDKRNLLIKVFGPPKAVAVAEDILIKSLLHLHESKQLEVHLRGSNLPHRLMKEVVERFGADLEGLKQKVPGADFKLNTRRHLISVKGSKESKQKVEEAILEVVQSLGDIHPVPVDMEPMCPICLSEVEDCYNLEDCGHGFCRNCLVDQCESAIRNHEGFPLSCAQDGCKREILLVDLRSLLPGDKLEELFRASLGVFVDSSSGAFRYCPSPDCPLVYRVADPKTTDEQPPFSCGACLVETCRRCHLEYHPSVSCEMYKEFKENPDLSLKEWCKGKDNVKNCPECQSTIEKEEGCNHIACRCGSHICWVCLSWFHSSDKCYLHLREVHETII
ncbi:ATP-dependent RNA helicase DEAH11, chloroplastic-like [Aristolochia californica]|uniref:ATP-dependent RNA helicase DEAH11, chloroplastic-like n=1 Tax=Aristolochia californica TaxID=171875 RepID=UPI0035D5DEFD